MGCDYGFFQRASEAADQQGIREAVIRINAVEAIESFASAHSERIEEIIDWPWKKFEALYDAFVKREQADRALSERNAYITGILANTNLDDGKQTKATMLRNIDSDYQNNLLNIYNIIEVEDEMDSPLFKAIKLPGSQEEATVPDRTTENLEEETDQGG